MLIRQSRVLAAGAALAAVALTIAGKAVGIGLLAIALALLSADRRLVRGACTLTLALTLSVYFPEGTLLWTLSGALLGGAMVLVRLAPQWLLSLLLLLPAYATGAATTATLLQVLLVGLTLDGLLLLVARKSYSSLLWPVCLTLTVIFPLLVFFA